MNVLNRLVMVVLLLIIILLVAVIAIQPEESFQLGSVFFDWARQSSANYKSPGSWPIFAAGRVIVGGALVILCLVLLWLELRRPKKKTVRVQKVAGGEAHVAIESIEQRLAYNIDQLPDVIRVTPRITGRSRGLDVELLLETTPDIDVPMKTEEVLEVTREVIVERMGLKLGKVQVKIKHAPYPKV
jgi:preprotein translocase subunit SecG